MEPPKADIFFEQKYEAETEFDYREAKRLAKELIPMAKEKKLEKFANCVVDLVGAMNKAPNGLISFPAKDLDTDSVVYGRKIYKDFLKALKSSGYARLVHDHKKHVNRAIYRIECVHFPDAVRVKPKAQSEIAIRVRKPLPSGRPRFNSSGKRLRGVLLRKSEIRKLPNFTVENTRIIELNRFLSEHPLQDASGKQYGQLTRNFNNSRFDNGGRLNGKWQQLKEHERLQLLIDNDDVCEIDIKACFLYLLLSIEAHKVGKTLHLPEDPYLKILFVRDSIDTGNFATFRKAAKVIVSSLFWNEKERKKFQRGFRDKYNVPKNVKYAEWQRDILAAFPELENYYDRPSGYEIMHKESELILGAMEALKVKGIPTYPVHDCLLCKTSDQEEVLEQIKATSKAQTGSEPILEVTYKDGSTSTLTN